MNERPVSESMRRVFDDLCHWLHVEPEHDGEVYTTCP